MKVAALFVATGGVYYGLPDVEPWGLPERDAREYAGPWPVVAHPPCSAWCQLARVNEARYGHKVGDDGGGFKAALASVRRWGGVLEHPAESLAWPAFGLPRPVRGGWSRNLSDPAGWVAEVNQRAYGHRASKRTWLYAVLDPTQSIIGSSLGAELPRLNWSRPRPEATVSFLTNHGGGDLPRLGKKEAKATPPAFRDVLLSIARSARRSTRGAA